MSGFDDELARLMTARGLGVRELARMVPCNPGHISNLRSGRARPSHDLAEILDDRLEAGGMLAALVPGPPRRPHLAAAPDDGAADEIAALDLGRRAEASEVGTGTVERLELAVDEMATAYPGTPSAEEIEEAEFDAAIAEHEAWKAAGRPGAKSHEEFMAELLGDSR